MGTGLLNLQTISPWVMMLGPCLGHGTKSIQKLLTYETHWKVPMNLAFQQPLLQGLLAVIRYSAQVALRSRGRAISSRLLSRGARESDEHRAFRIVYPSIRATFKGDHGDPK